MVLYQLRDVRNEREYFSDMYVFHIESRGRSGINGWMIERYNEVCDAEFYRE